MPITAAPTRWFTPEKADKTLPLVSAIVADIKELRESVKARQSRVDELLRAHGDDVASPYQDELEAMRRSLEEDRRQIRSFIGELTAVGVEVVDSDSASVEFPAWIEHRAVRLCWTLGQPCVGYYRELKDPVSTQRDAASKNFGSGPDLS